jgi:hypothetical protein
MKAVLLGAVVAITATLAHAEDMAEMNRHAHGLSPVKTDPQLTAANGRQNAYGSRLDCCWRIRLDSQAG